MGELFYWFRELRLWATRSIVLTFKNKYLFKEEDIIFSKGDCFYIKWLKLFNFFQILFIVLIFYSIPLTANFSFNSVTLPNLLAIKSIIFLNILLLFSTLNINPIYIFILTFGSLIFLIFKFKNIFSINLKINYFLIYFYIFVISIVMANHLEFAWDAKFFWFLKTINFFQENSLVNLDKLPATDYPHLGTYVWSFFGNFHLIIMST